MLKQELLEIICCPECKGNLEYNAQQSSLTCTSCGNVYEVKDDIPILLPKNNGN